MAKTWLRAGSKKVVNDVTFLGEKVLVNLFVMYSMAVPSADDSLFSI